MEFNQHREYGSDVTVILKESDATKLFRRMTGPIVLKFYAEWCGACGDDIEGFSEAATRNKGRTAFFAVNVDHCSAACEIFGVEAMPAYFRFHRLQPLKFEDVDLEDL